MFYLQKGQRLPQEILEMVEGHGAADYAKAITSTPMMAVIALNRMSEKEIDLIINGKLEIGAVCVEGVPFFTFKFEGMEFDTIVYSMESKHVDENALNIILVDSSNYTFQGVRVLGLDKELMGAMISFVDSIGYKKEDEVAKQMMVYNKYSTLQMHKMAKHVQKFEGRKQGGANE